MVNKARIRMWVKALRSGKYKKGTKALHLTPDMYCCLGVACDVYRKRGGLLEHGWESLGGLPKTVREWYGLVECDPTLGGVPATIMNDRHRRTFKFIADRIEEEFLGKKK